MYVVGIHENGLSETLLINYNIYYCGDDDDEFRFNEASTHEGHLHQNSISTWFCNEMAIMVSYACMKI